MMNSIISQYTMYFILLLSILIIFTISNVITDEFYTSDPNIATLCGSWNEPWLSYCHPGKIVFLTVVDTNYLSSAIEMKRSLMSEGIASSFIRFVCVTATCTNVLRTVARTDNYHRKDCQSLRCQISSAKIVATLDYLKRNVSVFFLDLDVYVIRNVLDFHPSPNVSMVVQYDSDTSRNFGLYYIRPNDESIKMFTSIRDSFWINGTWDQQLFSEYLLGSNNYAYEFFDQSLYINHMNKYSHDKSKIHCVHTTCVEGVYTKRLLAMVEYGYGTRFTFTHHRQVLSANISEQYSEEELAVLIESMVDLSNFFNRDIRFNSISSTPIYGVFSADKLALNAGVTLLPSNYWKQFTELGPKLTLTYEIHDETTLKDISSLNEFKSRNANANEIEIIFSAKFLKSKKAAENYLCDLRKEKRQNINGCLVVCDGRHFRRLSHSALPYTPVF